MTIVNRLVYLFDAKKYDPSVIKNEIDYFRISPFILLHLSCLLVFWVGVSKTAIVIAITLYFIRIFAITAFYHRYFAHRTYKTSRAWQFLFAVMGASAAQRGPLWWAAHHRHHHRHTDTPDDNHSPKHKGFWFSHVKWFLLTKNFQTNSALISDFMKYPELVFLDRFDTIVPVLLAFLIYLLGYLLNMYYPTLNTSGFQLLTWGFFISTIAVMHSTFAINSLAHLFGKKRYATKDASRNNVWLAILSLGEGWHNNHHHYPGSVKQGFFWWEIDITYYILKLMAYLGIIYDLRLVPAEIKYRYLHPLRKI
jgi:stearoyl-CoA desaturase (delta-9 desaturase)